MTTTAQITDWITAHTGECIDRTGHFGAQAPDLVNAYAADVFGLPHIFGHGHDVDGDLRGVACVRCGRRRRVDRGRSVGRHGPVRGV